MHFFITYMRGVIPTWQLTSNGWVSGNCPACVRQGEPRPDTKKRGAFRFGDDEWVYHCFNCKFKAGWSKGNRMSAGVKTLLSAFGVQHSDIQRINLALMREEETAQLLNPLPEIKEAYVPVWPTVNLPAAATMIMDQDPDTVPSMFEKGVTMLSERHLLHWTDWAYTASDFKYRKRMILPYRYNGEIVGHSSRYIGQLPDGKTPKYIVAKPPHFVFNLDHQTPDRTSVIVTEGDYDAISIDGVALGSNSLSDEQASIISQLNRRTILLPDADGPGNELIDPAINAGWSVSFPEWMETHKDANSASIEYGRAFVLQSTLLSATSNPTKIRVLAKKYLRG